MMILLAFCAGILAGIAAGVYGTWKYMDYQWKHYPYQLKTIVDRVIAMREAREAKK